MGVRAVTHCELLRSLRDRPGSTISELALRLDTSPEMVAGLLVDVRGVVSHRPTGPVNCWQLTRDGRMLLEEHEHRQVPMSFIRFERMMRGNVGVALS